MLHLRRPLPPKSVTLLGGFRPSNNWSSNYVRAALSNVMDVVDTKDLIQLPYCAPKNMKPNLIPFGMWRVKGNVIKDKKNEYFKMVRVQWWVPMKKRSNLDERHMYKNCWNGKWKCNLVDPEQWLDISTIFSSFPV